MEILTQRKETNGSNRIFIELSAKDFQKDFMIIAIEELLDYSKDHIFEVNNENKNVINQLYYYLTGNVDLFRGNLKKGIMLIGPFGVGKTTIMKIMARLVQKHSGKVFQMISCVQLKDLIQHHGMDHFERRPLILDEVGRETKIVKDFGTERKLFPEVIGMRYNKHAWTMATSNYTLEDLGGMYGEYIKDRLTEMFNFIELNGKSFRK